jgi:hypothetical protein
MKIFIVPGLSSPHGEKYWPVYELLMQEAESRLPGCSAEVLHFAGHVDGAGQIEGELEIPPAAEELRQAVTGCGDDDVRLICRSTGCNIASQLLIDGGQDLIRKAVFWGPPPYWLYYHMFVRHLEKFLQKGRDSGSHISRHMAPSAPAFESLLQEIDTEVLVCAGTEDEYCPPTYMQYLEWVLEKSANISFAAVPECGHGVDRDSPNVDLYLDTVLGWLLVT